MIQGIDHLVIVVKDLDQATRDYRELGFNVVAGGQHPVGSHNALIAFEDGSYLEIIAFVHDQGTSFGYQSLYDFTLVRVLKRS